MRKLTSKIGLLLLLSTPALARQAAYVNCQQGGQNVVTVGTSSTTLVMASYPGCQIKVFLTGTTTLANLFADNLGTPLSNPFTASLTDGHGVFYADNNRYDIQISGGLPSPGISPALTISDVLLNDPASPLSCSAIPPLTGDVTSAGGTCATVLPNIASPGTFTKLTVNAKGQITSGTSAASADLSDGSLLAKLNQLNNFGSNSIIAGPVTSTQGNFSGPISATSATISGEVAPDVTGRQLGDTIHRWDAFIRNLDVSGSITGMLSGSGTVNSIPKFVSSNSLGSSSVSDNGTSVNSAEPISSVGGSSASPAYNFSVDQASGMYDLSFGNVALSTGGIGRLQVNSFGTFIPSTECRVWNSGVIGSSQDTGICRDSAGVIDVGNGSPGNKSGTINAAGLNLTSFFSSAGISSSKAYRDCRQDGLVGDGITDDSAALNACLSNAATNNQNVNLPCVNILVNTSINDTNKPSVTVNGCGSSNPGITAGTGQGNTNVTTILCNTGNHPCIDRLGSAHSGWRHVNLVARNSFSTPSNIGMMLGRDPALDPNGGQSFCFSEFMHDDDVYVLMESSPTANNNQGRIAYYNVGGAEIFRITSSDLTADRPLYLTTTNATVGASSSYQTIIGACAASMEGWESSGTAYTPVSATIGGAITLEGSTNGLHNFLSGDCIMKSGSASGDYCLQVSASGSYGIKFFPAFTVEQIQGGGGVAFFNGTCTDCTFDVSTSSPSGMTNAWYQFSGGITTTGNSTAGIGAIDSVFAAHRVNPGDTPAPLLKCSGCGSPLVTLKGGRLELNSTTNPFSDVNTILSGSTVVGSGFTDANITFGTASNYILQDDSGISVRGNFGKVQTYNGVSTVGNGISATYAQSDLTSQSASTGTITLITGTASTGGHYRLCQAEGTSATDASGATYVLTFSWTSEGLARSQAAGSLTFAATSQFGQFCVPANVDASTNVTYNVTVTGTPTTGRYAVHTWVAKE